jgi:hypothetical protein
VALELTALLDAMESHAATSGHFERINRHEPKNAPDGDLTAAMWVQGVRPIRSGLSTTTVLVTFMIRLYQGMLSEPQDSIDPRLLKAADDVMSLYSGDFTLDGLVRNVDLLGEYSDGMSGQAGYLNLSGTLYRVFDITVPLVVNDLWEQAP